MKKLKLRVETPAYVILSSDYSAQEPRITSFLASDETMIQAFKDGKDVYAAIASIAFNVPYEQCLEFHPETHEYQPEGKARRGEAKTILLGILYGRSIPSIADQLYGERDDMSDEEKVKGAQHVFDSVMKSFPGLRNLTIQSQEMAKQLGYVTTILGRRRHLPDMQLPEFDFRAMPGYVNPDVDPLDITTLQNSAEIPERIVNQLKKEFAGFKYYGQVVTRTKELAEEKIRVINNHKKIQDATRQCVNCVDMKTEILTKSGWKTAATVNKGDEIWSYNIETGQLESDVVKEKHTYKKSFEIVHFESECFDAMATMDHRWVMTSDSGLSFANTRTFDNNGGNIQCCGLQTAYECDVPDVYLQVLGLLIGTDDTDNLDSLIERTGDTFQHTKIDLPRWLSATKLASGAHLTHQFINSLSTNQARMILEWIWKSKDRVPWIGTIALPKHPKLGGLLNHLCVMAGVMNYYNQETGAFKIHDTDTIEIYPYKQFREEVKGVWCVTTNNETWVARRNGTTFITGNSRVQGSAADQTKMAILLLENNEEWKAIGGRLLAPVHDELIAEVPIQYAEEGGRLLSSLMVQAADFLPFPSKCDVETSYRWYGLSYPCPYTRPQDVDTKEEDEVRWIQYHLFECEYLLPVFKDEQGNKPKGDAAKGISGRVSEEYDLAIVDYCRRFNVDRSKFLDDIERRVHYGD